MNFPEPIHPRFSTNREDLLSEKVPLDIEVFTPPPIGWTWTHCSTEVSRYPEFSGSWSRVADAGEQQRYVAGSDATITTTHIDGPSVDGQHPTIPYTQSIRAGDVIRVEPDRGRWSRGEWYRVIIPSQFRLEPAGPRRNHASPKF